MREFLLPIHVAGGGLAILLGSLALSVTKGGAVHRKSGVAFVGAMLAMGLSGTVLALRRWPDANAIGGIMSAYLVITALTTVHPPRTWARQIDIGAMFVALGLGVVDLVLGVIALGRPRLALSGVPAPAFLLFAVLGLAAFAGDLRVIRFGARRGAARLRRHLWRMCLAFFIAAASFFSIRARVAHILPEPLLDGRVRALPVLAILVVMIYWLWRVRVPHVSYARSAARESLPVVRRAGT